MSVVEGRIAALGLVLPPAPQAPGGASLPFPWVNVRGHSVYVSGHGPQNPDGSLAGPFGRLGEGIDASEGYTLARLAALSMLGSLSRELGNLDRIAGWRRVFGMVASAPGFERQPDVINGFSDLVLAVFGPDCGRHARSAVGMAALPYGIAVEVEAELALVG